MQVMPCRNPPTVVRVTECSLVPGIIQPRKASWLPSGRALTWFVNLPRKSKGPSALVP